MTFPKPQLQNKKNNLLRSEKTFYGSTASYFNHYRLKRLQSVECSEKPTPSLEE